LKLRNKRFCNIFSKLTFSVLLKREVHTEKTRSQLKQNKAIGTFALISEIPGQLIVLYQAFGVFEKMGGVSPSFVMGGLKVSMIPAFHGIVIFMISLIIWFAFDYIATRRFK